MRRHRRGELALTALDRRGPLRALRSGTRRARRQPVVLSPSGPLNAGPGIFTVKSQITRKSSGRILAIAIMRIGPRRIDTVSPLRYITVNEAYFFAPASPSSLGPRGIAGGV